MPTLECSQHRSIADRQSALEAELRTVQASRRDLENFLKWMQEAEATVNVLADASQREDALEDSTLARELAQQMEVDPQLMFIMIFKPQWKLHPEYVPMHRNSEFGDVCFVPAALMFHLISFLAVERALRQQAAGSIRLLNEPLHFLTTPG
ncbi:Utrophin [Galemys pyrenaicus]|uniref:Utrophin n=1 Tax=Galemys pyrenaicus TaxID=202257 RepID=A0A8J5ZR98_GALPY|nr:Utrophin [Galemys pyrenaicus]